eukprot:2660483-Pleurochrysis_carterae.AAC.1
MASQMHSMKVLFSHRQLKLGACMAPLAARLPSVCKPTLTHAQLSARHPVLSTARRTTSKERRCSTPR